MKLGWVFAVALVTLGVGGWYWMRGTDAFEKGVLLIPEEASWRYNDDGVDPPRGWNVVGFDHSGWKEGRARFGYGRKDVATVLARHVSHYFRREFRVDSRAGIRGLNVHLLRDDGAVVYVNGREVLRSNMPEGEIGPATEARWVTGDRDENRIFESNVDSEYLVDGTNLIAVEVHQHGAQTSDMAFDLKLVGATDLPYLTRGPYLQLATAHSIVVRWRTNSKARSVVRYGLHPKNLDRVASVPGTRREQVVSITGLNPETRYYYSVADGDRVLSGGDAEHTFQTSPPIGTATKTRVWAIGDSGLPIQDTRDVRDAYGRYLRGGHTDVWLMLGDNAYFNGSDEEYQAAVFETFRGNLRNTPLWPTLGNHDGHTADSATQTLGYYDIFTLPTRGEAGGLASGTEAYYSFDYGNIHFICLESHQSNRSPEGAMLRWLAADLADTTAKWIIAYWHHPPYTKGSHDSDREPRLIEMRENALPILEAGGVDLVLSGHSHSYERSFLIDGHYGESDTLSPSMIKDRGDGRKKGKGAYEKPRAGHEGAVYIVAGSSSHITKGPLDHPVMFVSELRLGSLVLEIEGDELRAIFLDEKAVQHDHFTLIKK